MTARRGVVLRRAALVARGVAPRARGHKAKDAVVKTAAALHQRRDAAAVAQVDVDIGMGQQPLHADSFPAAQAAKQMVAPCVDPLSTPFNATPWSNNATTPFSSPIERQLPRVVHAPGRIAARAPRGRRPGPRPRRPAGRRVEREASSSPIQRRPERPVPRVSLCTRS